MRLGLRKRRKRLRHHHTLQGLHVQKITKADSRGAHFRPPAASPIPSMWRLFAATLITSTPAANDYSNGPESPHNLLGKMMSQISADAKLSAVYTNHCVCATSITRMKSAHFEDRKICSVSGHRSATSLQAYDRLQ